MQFIFKYLFSFTSLFTVIRMPGRKGLIGQNLTLPVLFFPIPLIVHMATYIILIIHKISATVW
jgi:hypothetical protein